MYELKRVFHERKSNLFINSIKLAVSSQIDLSNIDRMKSLPNKSNLLLAYKRKEKRKKIKTLPPEQEIIKAKAFNTIDWVQEKSQEEFLDSHMEFKQYDSQQEQREIYSTHVPNIRAKDIRIKSHKPSVMVINEFQSSKIKAKKEKSISYSQIEGHLHKPSQLNIHPHAIIKKQKENSSRELKYLPQIFRIKNDRLSYKQIILGKSIEINNKMIGPEEKEPKNCNNRCFYSQKQKKVTGALEPIKLSRSLDHSLKVSHQDSNLLSGKQHIEANNQKHKVLKPQKKDLHFSPWSTKQSSFKEIK